MYLVKNLYQIHSLSLINFCLYFKTDEVLHLPQVSNLALFFILGKQPNTIEVLLAHIRT